MSTLTIPNTFTNGVALSAVSLQENFEAVRDWLNGRATTGSTLDVGITVSNLQSSFRFQLSQFAEPRAMFYTSFSYVQESDDTAPEREALVWLPTKACRLVDLTVYYERTDTSSACSFVASLHGSPWDTGFAFLRYDSSDAKAWMTMGSGAEVAGGIIHRVSSLSNVSKVTLAARWATMLTER
jgi:hypothetical protein